MVDYKYVIEILGNSDPSFYPSEESFWEALNGLAFRKNSKGLEELSESLTEFYFRAHSDCFRNYHHALEIAQKDLESYAGEADELYTNYKGEGTSIREFCREVIRSDLN